jgi:hypothetical protein
MASRIAQTVCICGEALDGGSEEVGPGAFIICIYCSRLMQLNGQLQGEPIDIDDVPFQYRATLLEMQIEVAKNRLAQLGRRN